MLSHIILSIQSDIFCCRLYPMCEERSQVSSVIQRLMKSWKAHTPSGIFLESSQCHAELLRLSRHFFTTETSNASVGYVKMEKGVEICCSRWWLAWELWMVDWNEWHSQSAAEKGNKQGRAFGSVILSFSLSKREQPWSMSETACWHRVTYFLPVCG